MPTLPMHTPGPWKVTENRRERTIQIDTANGRGTVVQPNAIAWMPDAALIAQAPAMRALLERVSHPDANLDGGLSCTHAAVLAQFVGEARAILRAVDDAAGGRP
jgi:hypothetical protein